MTRKQLALFYAAYSTFFIATCVISFVTFYTNQKSFIWNIDGLHQHYTALMYYGEYLRTALGNLLAGDLSRIPLWDFNIGYGQDILTTLHYYVIGDPFALLSVFVPADKTELLYNALIILRLWLSGISFSCYCRYQKKELLPTLIGTLIYVFCGYAMMSGLRHPYFLNPMVFFPLLLIGIEKIYEKKKPLLFIFMIFMSASSSFYFFYMTTLLICMYILLRFFMLHQKPYLKNLGKTFLTFSSYYIIGLMMAAVIFLPMVTEILANSRIQGSGDLSLLYDIRYYFKSVSAFLNHRVAGSSSYMGYTALSLPCLVLLFRYRQKYLGHVWSFCILTVLLLFPIGGYVFNGFSYVSNRWIWGFSFLVAYIVVTTLPLLLVMTRKDILLISLLSALYIIYCTALSFLRDRTSLISCVFLIITLFVLWYLYRHKQAQTALFRRISFLLLAVLTAAGAGMNTYIAYSPSGNNYVSEYQDSNASYTKVTGNETTMLYAVDDTDFSRYEEVPKSLSANHNSSLVTDLPGTSFYFSIANSSVYQYMKELEINIGRSFKYVGVEGRAIPGALGAHKYFLIKEDDENYLPYGYQEKAANYTKEDAANYYAYENEYVLPLSYTYSSYISRDTYDTLSVYEKQQALLQGVVLEDHTTVAEEASLTFTDELIPYEISADSEAIEILDDQIIVKEPNASVTLSFQGLDHAETYVRFQDLYYESSSDTADDSFLKSYIGDLLKYPVKKTRIKVHSSGTTKLFDLRTDADEWYEGIHNYTVHLGYKEKAKAEVRISFEKTGTYSCSDLSLTCQPMNDISEQISSLQNSTLEHTVIDTNRVSGAIELDQPSILTFSIPYSKGWSAYVNGEKTELLQANTMYMALPLDSGTYDIELRYVTPGLRTGLILSATGFILFFILATIYHKKGCHTK